MGPIDILVTVILAVALVAAVGAIIYRKVKHKGSGCGCGCEGCSSCRRDCKK